MPIRFSKTRAASFRIAAVALGLLPWVLVELVLSLAGWGNPRDAGDPLVGFRSTRPLFVLDQAKQTYETAANRRTFFRPESFSATKAPNEFRIFCLGGSTVQGRPFAIETSFTTWLELSLKAADPSRQWQVVNCGGVSYASYRLAPILKEVLNYRPDLVILYTGHNEFLEDRTYGPIKRQPALLAWATDRASRLRSFTLLREGWLTLGGRRPARPSRRPILPEEVQALLDYRGGLEHYHWDLPWRRGVIGHFQLNLRRMARMSLQAGVPIWIADPVCNLRDCPPFKSEHREGLTGDALRQWQRLRREASGSYKTDRAKAVEYLKRATDIDGQFAALYYDLAKCYESLGMPKTARQAYIQAKDLDVCPLRILEPMNRAVHDVCRHTAATLIPVRARFEQHCRDGVPGGYLLVDHVHPSIPGHQLIAQLLMEQLVADHLVRPAPGWRERRDKVFRMHLESLDDWYYVEGQRRLDGLRAWAAGRSTLAPPK